MPQLLPWEAFTPLAWETDSLVPCRGSMPWETPLLWLADQVLPSLWLTPALWPWLLPAAQLGTLTDPCCSG